MLFHAFHAGGRIYHIAVGRIVEKRFSAEIPHHRDAGMRANPCAAKVELSGGFVRLEVSSVGVQSEHAANGALGMIGSRQRCTEKHVQCVADNFIDGAIVFENDLAHAVEVAVEHGQHFGWLRALD